MADWKEDSFDNYGVDGYLMIQSVTCEIGRKRGGPALYLSSDLKHLKLFAKSNIECAIMKLKGTSNEAMSISIFYWLIESFFSGCNLEV